MTERCAFETAEDGSVRVTGDLTFESVPLLYREMERRLPSSGPVRTIDLRGVTRADSAGLALLLEWQSRQRRRGRELTIHNAPANLLRLAGLCEAIDLLKLSGRDDQS
jgi:phospholipid transport system transporter-binding protein